MLNKFALGAVFCLVIAFGIDFLSASSSKENSLSKLKLHIQGLINESASKVLEIQFQDAINTMNPSIDDLRLIEQYSDFFEENRISLELKKEGELIYWTKRVGNESVCVDSIIGKLDLSLCLSLFKENSALHESFSKDFETFHELRKNEDSSQLLEIGKQKISVEIGESSRSNRLLTIIITLYIIGLVLMFKSSFKKYSSILIGLLILRLVFYSLPLQTHFGPASLFNNQFGFAILNESIAGYIFNTLILFIGSIAFSKLVSQNSTWYKKQSTFKIFASIGTGLLVTVLFIYNTKCLIYFSDLNFDFEDLSKLKLLEQVCLGALTINALSLFIFNQNIYNQVSDYLPNLGKRYLIYFSAVLIAALLSILIRVEIPFFWIFSFLIALTVIFDLFSDLKSKNITWLIWWMIVFSLFIAAVLYHFDMRKDMVDRADYMDQIYHPLGVDDLEFFKSEFDAVSQAGYIQQIINKPLKDKFNTVDITEYIKYKRPSLDPLRLHIMTFDGAGNPLAIDLYENEEAFNLRTRHRLFINDNWSFDPLSNIYWVKEIMPTNHQLITLYFGFSDPVKTTELLDYPISYFKEASLILDDNNLSIEEQLLIIEKSSKKFLYDGANVFINYSPEDGIVLTSRKTFASIIKPVALFSFVFAIFGVVLLLISLLNGYFNFLPAGLPLKFWNINSFSIKIQLVIIILIIISFLGIAWVTVSFINDFINNNENQLIESKITSVSKNMNLLTREEFDFQKALEILNGSKSEFESIHQSSVNIYSNQSNSYFENIQNDKLDYLAHYYFNRLGSKFPLTIRRKGSDPRSYFLLNHHGSNEAIIGLGSNKELRANKLSLFDFLGSIVNVYVFLFLIAGAISIAVARSISRPLSVLGEKMQQLKLGSKNERLEWNSEDEIGALIENYNEMLLQLENSAEVLAKSERDMAWREMAKQVAHEIKNPLTPMKLSIQYLEKAMQSKNDDVKPLIKRISETLLYQINNLSEIADSFSNFAQLPQANNEKVSLNEVVETIHDLFRKREDIDIRLIEPIDSVKVYADKNHLVRILNNLVKNAIEAIPESRNGKIVITLNKDEKNATIKVKDNGMGIPASLHKKVFTPNFTTKNSGSGLGLAIASNMLDAFNARIYFETEEGKGTEFTIEIPLIRSAAINEDDSRVHLD